VSVLWSPTMVRSCAPSGSRISDEISVTPGGRWTVPRQWERQRNQKCEDQALFYLSFLAC
jgi:hypothetical protein